MKRKWITLQLLYFVMDAYRCNDNREVMYTLYVDFANAFDKVFLAILLENSIASESVENCYNSSGLTYPKDTNV